MKTLTKIKDNWCLNVVICSSGKRESLGLTLSSLKNNPSNVKIYIVSPGVAEPKIKKILSNSSIYDAQVLNEKTPGIYPAMNTALEVIDKGWVLFLGDDDSLLPNSFQIISKVLTHSTEEKAHFFNYLETTSKKHVHVAKFILVDSGIERGRMPTSHQAQIWDVTYLKNSNNFTTGIQIFYRFKIRIELCSDLLGYARAFSDSVSIGFHENFLTLVGTDGISNSKVFRRQFETLVILLNQKIITLFGLFKLLSRFTLSRMYTRMKNSCG